MRPDAEERGYCEKRIRRNALFWSALVLLLAWIAGGLFYLFAFSP